MNTQNAPLLIGILVLCAVFPHTCLTVGIPQTINSVTDRTHHISSVSGLTLTQGIRCMHSYGFLKGVLFTVIDANVNC